MPTRNPGRNIVLIGMPGAGKSTVGVLLAKALSMGFTDTDLYIQAHEGSRLQDIIDARGMEAFCRIEERHVLSLERVHCVIATGGSVVYSAPAMRRLGAGGVIVHLDIALDALKERLTNMDTRGVVMAPGKTIDGLYAEREPLYRRYADVTVDGAGTHEEVVARIVETLRAP